MPRISGPRATAPGDFALAGEYLRAWRHGRLPDIPPSASRRRVLPLDLRNPCPAAVRLGFPCRSDPSRSHDRRSFSAVSGSQTSRPGEVNPQTRRSGCQWLLHQSGRPLRQPSRRAARSCAHPLDRIDVGAELVAGDAIETFRAKYVFGRNLTRSMKPSPHLGLIGPEIARQLGLPPGTSDHELERIELSHALVIQICITSSTHLLNASRSGFR